MSQNPDLKAQPTLGYLGVGIQISEPLQQSTLQKRNHPNSSLLLTCTMSLSLQGKTAIVTGASRTRGIGAQVAFELARRGANVNCDSGQVH